MLPMNVLLTDVPERKVPYMGMLPADVLLVGFLTRHLLRSNVFPTDVFPTGVSLLATSLAAVLPVVD
jgi:hypothetical protein